MKKLFTATVTLLFLLIISISASAAQLDSYVIDENCRIVIGKACSENDKFAAETLSTYIGSICGITPSIETDDSEPTEYEIAVGETNRFTYDFASALDGSYVIKKTETGIAIYGYGNRGTIYGVYGFLEKYCGFDKYTATLTVVPKTDALAIPNDIDLSYNTYFEYTDTDWVSPRDVEYSHANGLSGGVYRTIPAEQGGTVGYIGQFAHTLSTIFCSAETYFAEHPEYFALHEGERVGNQLCLTNEDVYNIVLSEVMATLEENHNPKADLQILSLTQADTYDFCECEACKAIDDANGSHAGTMITFVNRIAAAVEEAGYDNVAIDTFAYQYTRKTPTQVVPLENVIVRLCTIECCFSHTLDDASCEENVSLMNDLAAWSKICDRLYIWDYTTNYAHTIGLFPDFAVLQKNLQIFNNNGVKGVYEEGNYYMSACDSEFGELRAYLLSKLMQNPYCDYDATMNDFLKAYYGEGWQNIRSFIDLTSESAAKKHLFLSESLKNTMSLSAEEVAQCDVYWENAINECKDDTQKANIERSLLSWRVWKAANGKSEFSGLFTKYKENGNLVSDLSAAGVTIYGENRQFNGNTFPTMFINADDWGGRANSPYATLTVILSFVSLIFLLIILFILVLIFVFAIKKKQYAFLIPLPLTAVIIAVFLWNRQTFLAWNSVLEFVISLIILSVYFAVMFIFMNKAKNCTLSKNSVIKSFILGALLYIVPHEIIIITINNVMNSGREASTAIAVALTYESIAILVTSIIMLLRFKKSEKTDNKSQSQI